MKKNLFVLMASSALFFACANEAKEVEAAIEEIPTEVVDELQAEQELNDEAHQLNDELEDFINEL